MLTMLTIEINVLTVAYGPKLTLVQVATNGGKEPTVTDAAACTDVRYSEGGKKPSTTAWVLNGKTLTGPPKVEICTLKSASPSLQTNVAPSFWVCLVGNTLDVTCGISAYI